VACVRQAWLVLGSQTVQLENAALGYFCQSLDLGYPAVREVTNNRPDQDGADDRTAYMGPRVVSASITALAGAGASIDTVAASFAPFMLPSVRPVLHYVLDRPGTADAERTLTLRASAYSWPIVGPFERDISLQWVASDPIARATDTEYVTAWSGSPAPFGRQYPLAFPRAYPAGTSGAIHGNINVIGDVAARPLLRIFGPITGANVYINPFTVYTLANYVINAGAWLDIDTQARTAVLNSDPSQNAAAAIDWGKTSWPVLTPGQTWVMALLGSSTTPATQVQAHWMEGYLS
jgi:hypothetical protein